MVATQQVPVSDEYMSTDQREMAAYREAISHEHELGDMHFDDEDYAILREAL